MQARGVKTAAPVEVIDIYPTICELAGLQKPEKLPARAWFLYLTIRQPEYVTARLLRSKPVKDGRCVPNVTVTPAGARAAQE